MAVKPHSDLLPPGNPGALLWRYMNLPKFIWLLEKRALYFARIDQLTEADPFEGYYTKKNLEYTPI